MAPLPFMGGMMTAGSPAALPSAITLGASLSAEAAASSVTSAAVVVTVPAGSSGAIEFRNLQLAGASALRFSQNGGFYQAVLENLTEGPFADGDTLALSVVGCAVVGDGAIVDIIDQSTGTKITTASLYRV